MAIDPMPSLKLTRTIHPVGQGAFYSEVFTFEDRSKFTIVYDCGSKTDGRRYLADEIIELNKLSGGVINYLFISHFDEDHVNGISLLKDFDIRQIVIPELSQPKWLSIIEYGIRNYDAWMDIMRFIEDNKGKVIQISQVSEDPNSEGPYQIWLNSERRNSGVPILPDELNEKWLFVPINFTVDPQKIKDLEKALYDRHILTDQIEKNDFDLDSKSNDYDENLNRIFRTINECYKQYLKNVNAASMVLYSGATNEVETATLKSLEIGKRIGGEIKDTLKEACLYTGDAELTASRCINITSTLVGLVSRISTLQLPHHGARSNFKMNIYGKYFEPPILTFASFGIDNRYHHPSHQVIMDVCDNGVFVPVAENAKAAGYFKFVQNIEIW